jgi:hypothetical protein
LLSRVVLILCRLRLLLILWLLWSRLLVEERVWYSSQCLKQVALRGDEDIVKTLREIVDVHNTLQAKKTIILVVIVIILQTIPFRFS